MKKYILPILLFITLTASSVEAPKSVPTTQRGIVVGIAGQSNASGRAPHPSLNPVDPLLFILGDDLGWWTGTTCDKKGSYRVDPVNYDSAALYGPCNGIADALHTIYPGVPVYFANCAKGSTNIEAWLPSYDESTLYGACLKKIYTAMSMGELAFIFSYQGETNAQPGENYADWDDNMQTIVDAIHSDFRADLPIVYAQIATTTKPASFPNWAAEQASQQDFENRANSYVKMIPTSDSVILADGVHINAASQYMIGQRAVYDGYCQIVSC